MITWKIRSQDEKYSSLGTVSDYNELVGFETLHPMVSVIDFSKNTKDPASAKRSGETQALSFGFYAVFLKEDRNACQIKYGRHHYDYQQGSLVFIAPGQVVSIETEAADYVPEGLALLFRPDLARGSTLAIAFKDYSFFLYHVHEALHISNQEKAVVIDCFQKIEFELKRGMDKHTRKLIIANIQIFLDYCVRFYERQFLTRADIQTAIVDKFELLLNDYFDSRQPKSIGIPTVGFFAKELHLSSNYFGDLLKKETGRTPLECIQLKMIEFAKNEIIGSDKSVSEVAYEVGFTYPQHFARFFKQHVGVSPSAYRSMN